PHRATAGNRAPGIMSGPVVDRARARMSVVATFEIEYLQYLGADGTLVAELPPEALSATEILPLFKQMLLVRTFDTKAIALQRTGKLGTYAASLDRKSTRLNSSHVKISYAVFCLKKKK